MLYFLKNTLLSPVASKHYRKQALPDAKALPDTLVVSVIAFSSGKLSVCFYIIGY